MDKIQSRHVEIISHFSMSPEYLYGTYERDVAKWQELKRVKSTHTLILMTNPSQ